MNEWVSMGCITLEFRIDDLNALFSLQHMNPVSFSETVLHCHRYADFMNYKNISNPRNWPLSSVSHIKQSLFIADVILYPFKVNFRFSSSFSSLPLLLLLYSLGNVS